MLYTSNTTSHNLTTKQSTQKSQKHNYIYTVPNVTNITHNNISLSKLLLHRGGDPSKSRILLLAPTGVAAININGTTIHSGLGIIGGKGFFPLSDYMRASLRNKLSEVRIIIIDEISMVFSKLLFQLNQRLSEIFGCINDIPFAGLPVILCGDFNSLQLIHLQYIYAGSTSIQSLIALDLWRKFKIAELTEVMRQKGDLPLIELLHKVRIGNIDESVDNALKPRFIDPKSSSYPADPLHIYAENKPANDHNEFMLSKVQNSLVTINAIDEVPKDCKLSTRDAESIRNRKLSDTGNLRSVLQLKVTATVMLTANIDIEDRLINGLVGTIMHFKIQNDHVTIVYVKFDGTKARLRAIARDNLARKHRWVPVIKHEVSFGIRKNKSKPCIKRTQFPLTLSLACSSGLRNGKKIILCLNFLFRVLFRDYNYSMRIIPVRYNEHNYNKNSIRLDE